MQPLNACASSCCIEIETFADRARFSASHQDRVQSTHANNVYRPFFSSLSRFERFFHANRFFKPHNSKEQVLANFNNHVKEKSIHIFW